MANQIARNFAAQGEDAAITATAAHIRDFWDPRMKSAILAEGVEGLEPIAGAAIKRIAG
ncbi:MAG: formate dehydrogenase subunit delta [Sphingomonadales bacterium]|nr:formate dehydrogenase subunit delta [Sphingomonadales bacterium]